MRGELNNGQNFELEKTVQNIIFLMLKFGGKVLVGFFLRMFIGIFF